MTIKMMPSCLSDLIVDAANDDDDFPLFVWSEYNDECERELVYIVDGDNTLCLDMLPEKALRLAKALTTASQFALNRERIAVKRRRNVPVQMKPQPVTATIVQWHRDGWVAQKR